MMFFDLRVRKGNTNFKDSNLDEPTNLLFWTLSPVPVPAWDLALTRVVPLSPQLQEWLTLKLTLALSYYTLGSLILTVRPVECLLIMILGVLQQASFLQQGGAMWEHKIDRSWTFFAQAAGFLMQQSSPTRQWLP